MPDKKGTIGFALCGSYCTFARILPQIERLVQEGYEVVPIMSENAYATDTRFGSAESFRQRISGITGQEIIHTIVQAEPIGPKAMLDAIVIAPCTGNTLAKMACAITDTSVTMAAKAHLRNEKPVLIAVSTNDGLTANAKNIGTLLNTRNIYFVPFGEDDPIKKPRSLVANMEEILPALELALQGKQIQPVIT